MEEDWGHKIMSGINQLIKSYRGGAEFEVIELRNKHRMMP